MLAKAQATAAGAKIAAGRQLRNLDRREATARKHLGTVDKPVAISADLIDARHALEDLQARAGAAERAAATAQTAVDHVASARPRGLWAWLIGRKSEHDKRAAAAATARDKTHRLYGQAEQAAAKAEREVKAREVGWVRKLSEIKAERVVRRKTILAELAWIADARAAIATRPGLAHADDRELAAAVDSNAAPPEPRPPPRWLAGGNAPRYAP